MAEKRDLRTYANTENSDQPAHPQSGQDIRCSPTQCRDLVEYYRTNTCSENLDPTHDCANWSGASPFLYALRAFLSAGGPNEM